MRQVLIYYDLKGPKANYADMYRDLDASNAYQVTKSCYIIRTDYPAKSWRDFIKQHLKKDDRLFVVEFDDWADWGTQAQQYLSDEE